MLSTVSTALEKVSSQSVSAIIILIVNVIKVVI